MPVLKLLGASIAELRERADAIASRLDGLSVEVQEDQTPVGGGSLPGAEMPTVTVRIRPDKGCEELARRLRAGTPSVFPRHQRWLRCLRSAQRVAC